MEQALEGVGNILSTSFPKKLLYYIILLNMIWW